MGSEVDAGDAASLRARPLVLEWEHLKIGDRLAGFTLFLPARPRGPVLLAVSPMVGNGLRWRFDEAVLLTREPDETTGVDSGGVATLRWDGAHLPVREGSVGLLIVDTRHADPEVLRPALAPDGTLAVLGEQGDLMVYPDVDRPENLWRTGWPIPAMHSVRAQLRRTVGLRIGLGRELIKLRVEGPGEPTFVEELLSDLTAQTGDPCEVLGVQTAGDTVVRVRAGARDLAVRVSLTIHDRNFGYGAAVAAEVPAIRDVVQQPIAEGTTHGVRWVATEWLPRTKRAARDFRRATAQQWRVAEQLSADLAEHRTGSVDAGWAQAWIDAVTPIVEETQRDQLCAVLADVEPGTPTGWAHGDLWPGNVLVDHEVAAVIDWENCAREAPLGIDRLLVTALRARIDEQISVARACGRLIDEPDRVDDAVGGRSWTDWPRAQRAALATAAYVLHLRNRALFDVGFGVIDSDIAELLAVVHGADVLPAATQADDGAATSAPASGDAGRTARGAVWLGASAFVVKAAQTAVLLVLAALLAPAALGLVAIGTLVMNVSTVVSDLGTSSALVYFRGDVRRAARSAVTVAAGLGLLVTAGAWLIAPWLCHALRVDAEGIDVIRGLTSVLPFYAVASVHLELIRRKLQFAKRIVPDVVATAIGATVSIVLAVQGHGVAALVVGQILQGVLTLLVVWLVSQPVLPGWNMTDVRALVGYGGHLSGANLAQLALLNIDYLMVSRVLGADALGQYSLAFRLAYLPYLNLAVVIGGAAFPYLCRLRGERLGNTAERITGLTITLVLPVCAGIALVADQLELLGHEWAPAVPALRWLMVYTLVLCAGQLAQVALNAMGRPRTTLAIRVLHVVALGTALILLTHHGIEAVGVAQAIAVAIITTVALFAARRNLVGFEFGRLARSLTPAFVGGVIMIGVVVALDHWLPGARVSATRLLTLSVAGAVSYLVPVWLLDRERITQTVALLRGGGR